jgi:hypothetical protein
MERKARLLCALLLLLYFTGRSQFNDTTHYHMNFAATGTFNKASAGDSYVLNNALGFDVNKKKMSLNSSNSWVYGQSQGRVTNNDFSSTLNFDLYRAVRTWYYWGLASYTSSYSLKISNQFQAGAGIGYNAVRKDNEELVISDGILFESSNLYNATTGKSTYVTARNSLRVKYRWIIWKSVVLDGMQFWQPALNDISNYIVRSTNNLSVGLNKWLSIGASLTYNRFNKTNSENLLINFGLTVDKYF